MPLIFSERESGEWQKPMICSSASAKTDAHVKLAYSYYNVRQDCSELTRDLGALQVKRQESSYSTAEVK